MAEYRLIKVKIWQDIWFLSLNSQEKMAWIYLLTNPFYHISGVYELPKPLLGPLLGSLEEVDKTLSKFENDGKIVYREGWVYIKNHFKNQSKQLKKKDNITKSIMAYLSENSEIIERFNLENIDPYRTLLGPLGKEERGKRKEERGYRKDKGALAPRGVNPPPTPLALSFFSNDDVQLGVVDTWVQKLELSEDLVSRVVSEFVDYWTDEAEKQKCPRWQAVPKFDLQKRLARWFRNSKLIQFQLAEDARGNWMAEWWNRLAAAYGKCTLGCRKGLVDGKDAAGYEVLVPCECTRELYLEREKHNKNI